MVRFRLLGQVEIAVDDRALMVPRPRRRAVLSYLLLAGNRLVTTEAIIDALWDDSPPATARNQIQAEVCAIRRLLREVAGADAITTTSTGYRLAVTDRELDVLEFHSLIATARSCAGCGQGTEAARLTREALALWRGPALGDVRGRFAGAARVALEEQRLAATEALAEIELALGNYRSLVAELTSLAHDHPLREGIIRPLALALHRCGRSADALGVLRAMRAALADEHGIDPTPAMEALELSILRGDPGLATADHTAVPLANATYVDIEVDPRMAAAVPATVTTSGPSGPTATGNLRSAPMVKPAVFQQPASLSDFVGREKELARLSRIISDQYEEHGPGSCTIISISGMAGAGKTSLALRAANDNRHLYPEGCLYAELRATSDSPSDPLTVLGSFLRALGLAGQLLPPSLTERSALYRAMLADRQMLVLLDDARDERQVGPLIPSSGSALVITGRAHVNLPGAHFVDVGVLPVDDGLSLLARVAGTDQVNREPDAARRVIDLCGQLPLAIRVAAVRLAQRDTMSIVTLSDRLGDERRRLDELAVSDQDVRASLEIGYRLLSSPAERLLGLLALSPFPTFTPGLGAAVLETSTAAAEGLLEELRAAHLLFLTSSDRYAVHDLVRLHARQRLAIRAPSVVSAALERTCLMLLDGARYANGHLPCRPVPLPGHSRPTVEPPADPVAWFETERENLTAATSLAAELMLPDLAGQLAAVMINFCMMRGYQDEWELCHGVAMQARHHFSGVELDSGVEAYLYLGLGNVHRFRDDSTRAMVTLRRARRLFRRAGMTLGLASATVSLGACAYQLGQDRIARAALDSADALLAFEDPTPLTGYALIMRRARLAPSVAAELAMLRRGLAVFNAIEERWGAAEAHTFIASALRRAGELAEAVGHAEEAIAIYTQLQDRLQLTVAEIVLANIYLDLNCHNQARSILSRTLQSSRDLRHPWGEASALRLIGQLDSREGSRVEAISHLEAAAGILRRTGQQAVLAATLKDLRTVRRGGFAPAGRRRVAGTESIVD